MVSHAVPNQQRRKCRMNEWKEWTEKQGWSQNSNQQMCMKEKGNQIYLFVRQNHKLAVTPCNYLHWSSPSCLLSARELEVLCHLLTMLSGTKGQETAMSDYPGLLCRCLQGWVTSSSSLFSVHFLSHSGQVGQGQNYSLTLTVDMLQLIGKSNAVFKKISENGRRWHSAC